MRRILRFTFATFLVAVGFAVSFGTIDGGIGRNALAQSAPKPIELSARDRADLRRMEDYLNNITTLAARFVQITNDGRYSEGKLYVSRPGRFRFEYAPPVPFLLVANDDSLLFYDSKLKQVSYIDADEYPALQLLLAKKVSFTDGIVVTGMNRQPGIIQVAMTMSTEPGAGELALTFSDQPFELRKWTTIDPQGVEVNVALFNARRGLRIDSDKFSLADPTRLRRGRD